MRLSPGTQVGPYEVISLLGTGGMAEVYRARDTRLGRDVAIKVVSESLGDHGSWLERLDREARLAALLNHPNVVALYDVGVHDGSPYFVTELLEGESLRAHLSRGPVPLWTAVEWIAQATQALAAAHERGIVHRDLKPENLFITRTGQVKLLDFGIAKMVEEAQRTTAAHALMDDTMPVGAAHTVTGMILGTPGYMSPEQTRGDPLDARTDLFSLGTIAFELLSGHRAFPGTSFVESGYAILHAVPDPLPSTVPSPLAGAVLRCLEKDPEQRLQSARELVAILEIVQQDEPSDGPTERHPGSRERGVLARKPMHLLTLGTGSLVLVALVAAMVLMLRQPVPSAPSEAPGPKPTNAGLSKTTLPAATEAARAATQAADGPVTQERQLHGPGLQKEPKSPDDHIREIDKLLQRQLGKASTESAYDRAIELAIRDPVVAGLYSVPPALVKAIIRRESNFNPRARSSLGAIGLMQLMPVNAEKVGLTETDLWIPEKNILGGTRLLAALLRYYKGNVPAALVAYNAKPQDPSEEVPSNGQTREYVAAVLQYYDEYSADRGSSSAFP